MSAPASLAVAAAGLLVLAGCSPGGPAPVPTGQALTEQDAGTVLDAGPPRTLVHRPLLATSTRNLLLDPFVTSDASWGHFITLVLTLSGAQYQLVPSDRSFVSASPAGISAPVARLRSALRVQHGATMMEMVAPFPGGADPLSARVWVSGGDFGGDPVDFASVADFVEIAILPNDQPDQKVPLVRDGAPLRFGAREWVRFALPVPLSLPRGGWMSIFVIDSGITLQLQAPEITPTGMVGPVPLPPASPREAHHRAALLGYAEQLRRRP